MIINFIEIYYKYIGFFEQVGGDEAIQGVAVLTFHLLVDKAYFNELKLGRHKFVKGGIVLFNVQIKGVGLLDGLLRAAAGLTARLHLEHALEVVLDNLALQLASVSLQPN